MATKYLIDGDKKKPVICQSLTFGYLYDIEQGIIEDDMMGALQDGCDLDLDGVRALTRIQVTEIWEIIKKETYPELYDVDGNPLDLDDEPSEDKKKA